MNEILRASTAVPPQLDNRLVLPRPNRLRSRQVIVASTLHIRPGGCRVHIPQRRAPPGEQRFLPEGSDPNRIQAAVPIMGERTRTHRKGLSTPSRPALARMIVFPTPDTQVEHPTLRPAATRSLRQCHFQGRGSDLREVVADRHHVSQLQGVAPVATTNRV